MSEEKTEEVVAEETSSSKENTTKQASESGQGKILFAIVIVVILIVGALEMTGTTKIFGGATVAVVNGEKISQVDYEERLNQILSSEQAQALNLEDPALRASIEEQILNEMVNTRLLLQAARAEGLEITEAEVQTEYQLILDRLGGPVSSEEEKLAVLTEELAKNGLTEAEFRQNIADQLRIEQYFTSKIDESLLLVTDEEITLYYEQLSELQPDVPPLEEIRAQIETQLVSQKRQQEAANIVVQLSSEADIEIIE